MRQAQLEQTAACNTATAATAAAAESSAAFDGSEKLRAIQEVSLICTQVKVIAL